MCFALCLVDTHPGKEKTVSPANRRFSPNAFTGGGATPAAIAPLRKLQ